MELHHVHRGSGEPLLLVPGLGSTWRSFDPILEGLAAEREVIAVDLPGFGESPPLDGEVTMATLADALTSFIDGHDLAGIDLVGSSTAGTSPTGTGRRPPPA